MLSIFSPKSYMIHTPKISYIAIAGMWRNRIIGNDGKIPWSLPEDFKHFHDTTLWHPIVMGRKTFESIGKVLPWRENIVLTRGDFSHEWVTVVHSLEGLDAYLIEKSRESQEPEFPLQISPHVQDAKTTKKPFRVFVCGGSQIYEEFFRKKKIDEVILSLIDLTPEGDATFPYFESDFTKVEEKRHHGFTIEYWKFGHIPHQDPYR